MSLAAESLGFRDGQELSLDFSGDDVVEVGSVTFMAAPTGAWGPQTSLDSRHMRGGMHSRGTH